MILLSRSTFEGILSHCLDDGPLEACGLIAGSGGEGGRARIRTFFPTSNSAGSARVYEVEPRALLVVDRQVEQSGDDLIGVYHSHTHTEAWPSPTDIRQAPDPSWRYVLVTLRDTHPALRCWKIVDGKIEEEPVVLEW